MPKLEANLQWMFNEYDVLDRYDEAAKLGFKGVEIQSPYEFKIQQIKQKLNTNNLKQIIINTNIIDNDTGLSNLILRSDKTEIYNYALNALSISFSMIMMTLLIGLLISILLIFLQRFR